MDKEEFLQLRKCRRDIISMCCKIYDYDIYALETDWKVLKKNIGELLGGQADLMLQEVSECINKKNWIRIRDVLLYLDDSIRQELNQKCSIFQSWRDDIWKENYFLLKGRNSHLADKISNMENASRIEVAAGGTECCIIRIHEGNKSFQLFSSENPWLECTDHIGFATTQTQEYLNIYQLGFNGGFLTGVIAERFPAASINVYVPNLDIFAAVLHNVYLADILNKDNLYFFYDPLSLDFAKMASSVRLKDKSLFLVDKIEYRALLHGGKNYTNECLGVNKHAFCDIQTVGRKIYTAISE